MDEQQGTQQQPDFIPVGATPDFIPAEEAKPKPVTVSSDFKARMPGWKDVVHAAGVPTSWEESEQMGRAEAGKSAGQKLKEAAVTGMPGMSFLPAMAKEGWRGLKGSFSSDPTEQAVAPIHAGASLLPFAAPVVDAMTEKGLGTKEANAIGVVGAGTNAAALLGPRLVPPIVRGTARGVNAALEKAPGLVGATVGEGAGQMFGHPHVGGAIGYALGRDLLPKLRIPGERFGLPPVENRVMTPTGSAPASEPTAVPAAPLKAKTLAGQNAEVLKRSGIAGPKSTLKPLAEIPKGELTPDPHYDFQHVRSGEQAITQQISSHPLNKLRAIATQRGIKVAPSDTNKALIQKIADSATPAEIDAFEQARIERMHPNYAPATRRPIIPEETRGTYVYEPPKPGFGTAKIPIEERTTLVPTSKMGEGEIVHPEDNPTIEEEEDYFKNFKSNLPEKGVAPRTIEGVPPRHELPENVSGIGGGKNYVVTKSGIVSAHGKLFDPSSTPRGGTHVTVLPDGSIRVNTGRKLTLSQETALKKAIAAR